MMVAITAPDRPSGYRILRAWFRWGVACQAEENLDLTGRAGARLAWKVVAARRYVG